MSDSLNPQQIAAEVAQALEVISVASDLNQLRAEKGRLIGDSSAISKLYSGIGKLPATERAAAGQLLNQARQTLTTAFESRETELKILDQSRQLAAESVDMSAATIRRSVGARHPLSLLMDSISEVFVGMGWEIADGPELESEWFNFDALNFDADHPARAMQDTFFVQPAEAKLVLRTHTSPVQVRSMLERKPPIYVLCPGRVFRTDELDATHTPVFHQVEGLAIDKGLTMAHLKGTLEHFARVMFGPEAKIRLRPSYFPFTEPSAELDVWHPNAKGGARWVEWGGCGMVNPNVLIASGINPEEYSGFAFGMGIERTLMFRNGVRDMHDMVEADIRFSKQFGARI